MDGNIKITGESRELCLERERREEGERERET
jgi:hypothetical protein